ncbi:hypothetical protein [Gloeocapsa sp. PCC 7428]|uniref:hypothetical protein n=1 Tax=Gloeocapsa sp. PCC 7428 TaxID=1173026 RepID=UPI001E48ACF5|nr:hypothetical protein [Gloeocapsa sp. PCC 7428]
MPKTLWVDCLALFQLQRSHGVTLRRLRASVVLGSCSWRGVTRQLLYREQVGIGVKQVRAKGAAKIMGEKLLDSCSGCPLWY